METETLAPSEEPKPVTVASAEASKPIEVTCSVNITVSAVGKPEHAEELSRAVVSALKALAPIMPPTALLKP